MSDFKTEYKVYQPLTKPGTAFELGSFKGINAFGDAMALHERHRSSYVVRVTYERIETVRKRGRLHILPKEGK